MVRSPRFDIAPSFCLPPVDFCSGVSASQAAKLRPAWKPSAAGTSAVIAVAVIGPTPGIVISRRATASSFARRLISTSSCLICTSNAVKVSIRIFRIVRALSGKEVFGSGRHSGPHPAKRRCRTLLRPAATHPRGADAGRHDRDCRVPGGRRSARPDERADLRGQHAGQHRRGWHLFVRRDRRLAERGWVHQPTSVAGARPRTADPRDTTLTQDFFTEKSL